MDYGFEYQTRPALAGHTGVGGTPYLPIPEGMGEKWFQSAKVRDHFMRAYQEAHPGSWVHPLDRPSNGE